MMSDGNASDNYGRKKRTRFAAPEEPSEVTLLQTRGSPFAAARDHVNFNAVTLHDKLEKIVVCCAADFMTRRQILYYNISSQQRLKTEDECVPKSTQIKLELAVFKLTKEGKAFQDLSEKHSQVIAECQFQLKSLFIEAWTLPIT